MKTDLLYVLGKGSRWDNNEIRFSIRSAEKHLKGLGKIIIVGELPSFIEGCIHIYHPDEFGEENADGNIIRKVLRACLDKRVSEKFLFINDDHVFLKDIRINLIPSFHKGDLHSFPQHYFGVNPWRKRLYATMLALDAAGLPALHYDCHTPILFEKEKFIEAMNRFDYACGNGLTMKSLYGNVWCQNGPQLSNEKKVIFQNMTIRRIEEKLMQSSLMAFNDDGLNDSLKIFLYQNFREPSSLETSPIDDKIIDIYIAARESNSYEMAVDTFVRYFKNENIKNMIARDRNSRFENKVKYLLEQKLKDL